MGDGAQTPSNTGPAGRKWSWPSIPIPSMGTLFNTSLVALLVSMLAVASDNARDLFSAWLAECRFTIDQEAVITAMGTQRLPIRISLVGKELPKSFRLAVQADADVMTRICFLPDMRSNNRAIHSEALNGDTRCQGNGQPYAYQQFDVAPVSSIYDYYFLVDLAQTYKANTIAAFISFEDKAGGVCRVERKTIVNLLSGATSGGRFLFLVAFLGLVGLLVARLKGGGNAS